MHLSLRRDSLTQTTIIPKGYHTRTGTKTQRYNGKSETKILSLFLLITRNTDGHATYGLRVRTTRLRRSTTILTHTQNKGDEKLFSTSPSLTLHPLTDLLIVDYCQTSQKVGHTPVLPQKVFTLRLGWIVNDLHVIIDRAFVVDPISNV